MPLTYRTVGNKYQIASYSTLFPTPVNLFIPDYVWYKFNTLDSVSSTVYNYVSSLYDGVIYGAGTSAVVTTQSKFGGSSLYFPGTVGNFFVGPQFTYSSSTGCTVAFWAYITNSSSNYDIWGMQLASLPLSGGNAYASSSTYKGQWIRVYTSNSYLVYQNEWGLNETIGSFTPNTWVHLAFVIGANSALCYTNGSLAKTISYISGTTQANGVYFPTIATGLTANGPYTGYVDDFRIYNSSLSASVISQVYGYNGA
jgi:hypothetical protein